MIVGKRVYLRTLSVEDCKKMLESLNEKEIRLMTNTQETYTEEQIIQHIININNDDTREDYAICINESDEMIGELSILDIDYENENAGFRIALSTIKNTGQGYGSEAISLVLEYVFNTLNLNRIQLEVYSFNKRGIRAYEKVGFKEDGRLREAIKVDGIFYDEIIMSIIRKDYMKEV